MAIYHLSAKIVTRAKGQSVVASAAYRSAGHLHDERIDQTFDYTRKVGVEHTEILAPEGAPAWVFEREKLWNAVERAEQRKDAQLAREIELALPVELGNDDQVELVREFARRSFVSKGMVVDFAIHRDNPENPHAHLLLTTRDIGPAGFGAKRRDWNAKEQLLEWRAAWAETANAYLALAGPDLRIDHRTLQAQGIDLEPGRKIGVGQERQLERRLPHRIAERVAEQQAIARENGQRILAEPTIALKALTHHQATFTEHDIAKFLHTRTDGAEQFRAAYLKVATSADLIAIGTDERGRPRYTSHEMLETERRMLERAAAMTRRNGHGVTALHRSAVRSQGSLSAEQRVAFDELTTAGDLKALVGVAGTGKSKLLATTREAWEAEGLTVKGAALSGIAAENLQLASGISSRTLASYEWAWSQGRDPLTPRDVLVIDEAGMVGTRQLARVLEVAEKARAKVVLVGDPEQLQAIEAGAAFRGIMAESGVAELNEVRRQAVLWQREATSRLARGETTAALETYEKQGAIVQTETGEAARAALLAQWAQDGRKDPRSKQLMLAYTRADVSDLNERARAVRKEAGHLGRGEVIETERGAKEFAVGDRLYFLRNERSLGVKNGSLGTVESVKRGVLQVQVDGTDQRIAVDTHLYKDLDYGYAATVYKAQGATVDRSYVLVTSHYDRHATYVALSRHRQCATVFYAPEDFEAPWDKVALSPIEARRRFLDVLSRARPKELVHDYLDREPNSASSGDSKVRSREWTFDIAARQQQAAEYWRDRQHAREKTAGRERSPTRARGPRRGHSHGPELDQ